MIKIVTGNLLTSPHPIIHQCNCVTTNSAFLAKQIFDRYPFANTYSSGVKRIPGTVDAFEGDEGVIIFNLYAQYYPGPSKYVNDSEERRLAWFKECLDDLSLYEYQTFSAPYKIGCGSAGGEWELYLDAIRSFCEKYNRKIVLYKLK